MKLRKNDANRRRTLVYPIQPVLPRGCCPEGGRDSTGQNGGSDMATRFQEKQQGRCAFVAIETPAECSIAPLKYCTFANVPSKLMFRGEDVEKQQSDTVCTAGAKAATIRFHVSMTTLARQLFAKTCKVHAQSTPLSLSGFAMGGPELFVFPFDPVYAPFILSVGIETRKGEKKRGRLRVEGGLLIGVVRFQGPRSHGCVVFVSFFLICTRLD